MGADRAPALAVLVDDDGLVRRSAGEEPFALITRLKEHRLWRVSYRDGAGFVEGGNCSFPTRAKAIAECEWAARRLTAHQLGLEGHR